jgi:hypothetical protein
MGKQKKRSCGLEGKTKFEQQLESATVGKEKSDACSLLASSNF